VVSFADHIGSSGADHEMHWDNPHVFLAVYGGLRERRQFCSPATWCTVASGFVPNAALLINVDKTRLTVTYQGSGALRG
jgi:hypothetical protein